MKYKMSARGGSASGGKKTKIILILLLIFPLLSSAQENKSVTTNEQVGLPSATASIEVEGTSDCFDYYKFGSVHVGIESPINSTIPGVPLSFRTTIKNDNNYPIVDGSVYIKIFKKQKDLDKAHANGFFLLDQFFAKENISLDAKGEKEFDFSWTVPNYVEPGNYQAVAYFISSKKFNLLGLSFTDDVKGDTFNFTIKGESQGFVQFDKNTVKINDLLYHFAAFPPRISKDENVNVTVELGNWTKSDQNVSVTWTLYQWDNQNGTNALSTKKETVAIKVGGSVNLEYNVEDKNYPVYYLVAEAEYEDAKSILGIRIVRDGVDGTRLNFAGIMKYPLRKGESNSIIACVHGMGYAEVVNNNKLIMTLSDLNGHTIRQHIYNGDVSGAIMGLRDDFTPIQNLSNFVLVADLYRNNQLVDSVRMRYDCEDINKQLCSRTDNGDASEDQKFKKGKTHGYIIILLILIGSIVAIISTRLIKKRNSKLYSFLFFLIFIGTIISGIDNAEAKSAQWTELVQNNLGYYWNRWDNANGWSPALKNPTFTITYNAKITNLDTEEEITDGSQIPVGTRLRFDPIPFEDTDISWFGTGYCADSPFGHWINNAGPPSGVSCGEGDFVQNIPQTCLCGGTTCGGPFCPPLGPYDVFIPFSVDFPRVTVSQTGTANLICSDSGRTCSVNSTGTIDSTFIFSNTHGKLYYRYRDLSGIYGPTTECHGNDMPLRICRNGFVRDGSLLLCKGPDDNSYTQPIPSQSIIFNLSAVDSNYPPLSPIITKDTGELSGQFVTGIPNIPYSFNFTATDPENDQIRYGVDWNADDKVDQFIPASGNVASGTMQQASNPQTLWPDVGSQMFQARTYDEHGAFSGWTEYDLTLADSPYDLTVTISGSGNVTSNPSGIDCQSGSGACSASFVRNSSVNLTASPIPGLTEFTGWGGDCSGAALSCSLTMNTNKTVTANFHNMVCTPQCGDTGARCIGETWDNGCPPIGSDCEGTKPCNENRGWREVAP